MSRIFLLGNENSQTQFTSSVSLRNTHSRFVFICRGFRRIAKKPASILITIHDCVRENTSYTSQANPCIMSRVSEICIYTPQTQIIANFGAKCHNVLVELCNISFHWFIPNHVVCGVTGHPGPTPLARILVVTQSLLN